MAYFIAQIYMVTKNPNVYGMLIIIISKRNCVIFLSIQRRQCRHFQMVSSHAGPCTHAHHTSASRVVVDHDQTKLRHQALKRVRGEGKESTWYQHLCMLTVTKYDNDLV